MSTPIRSVILWIAVALPLLAYPSIASQQDNYGAWQTLNTDRFSHSSDSDKLKFDVHDNRYYAVKVEPASGGPFEITITDDNGREFAHSRGSGMVVAAFDTFQRHPDNMRLTATSRGAVGDYTVYLRESLDSDFVISTSDNYRYDDTSRGNYGYRDSSTDRGQSRYTMLFPDEPSSRNGNATITFRGNAVTIDGTVYLRSKTSQTWTGNGTVRGDRMELDWQLTNGDRGTATLDRQRNGDWEGTYITNRGSRSSSSSHRLILRAEGY